MTLRAQPITEEWQAGIREGNPAQYVVVSQMASSYIYEYYHYNYNKSLYDSMI